MSNVRRLCHHSTNFHQRNAALAQRRQDKPSFPVAANRTQARTNRYAHLCRDRLPERTVAEMERAPKLGESESTREVSSGCPSRFAGGQRTVVAPRRNRAPRTASKLMYASRQQHANLALAHHEGKELPLVLPQPPNPSIEGTASGLRPPAAPHVTR
jgi:hypothetical protein